MTEHAQGRPLSAAPDGSARTTLDDRLGGPGRIQPERAALGSTHVRGTFGPPHRPRGPVMGQGAHDADGRPAFLQGSPPFWPGRAGSSTRRQDEPDRRVDQVGSAGVPSWGGMTGDGAPARPARSVAERLAAIASRVAARYGVRVQDLQGRRRTREIAWARHVAMYLGRRRIPRASLEQIGAFFGGRDHSTVIHAIRRVEATRRRACTTR